MKRITKRDLERYHACSWQVELFAKLYPRGVPICRDCAAEAQTAGLDIAWLTNFLNAEDRCFIEAHTRVIRRPWIHYYIDPKGRERLEQAFLKKRSWLNTRY